MPEHVAKCPVVFVEWMTQAPRMRHSPPSPSSPVSSGSSPGFILGSLECVHLSPIQEKPREKQKRKAPVPIPPHASTPQANLLESQTLVSFTSLFSPLYLNSTLCCQNGTCWHHQWFPWSKIFLSPSLSISHLCSLQVSIPSLGIHVTSCFWFSSHFLGHSILGVWASLPPSDLRSWSWAILSPCSFLSSWVVPSVWAQHATSLG